VVLWFAGVKAVFTAQTAHLLARNQCEEGRREYSSTKANKE